MSKLKLKSYEMNGNQGNDYTEWEGVGWEQSTIWLRLDREQIDLFSMESTNASMRPAFVGHRSMKDQFILGDTLAPMSAYSVWRWR